MGEKPHREDFLPVIVDRGDEAKIVRDNEDSDGSIASDSHLICMAEGLAGLCQVLPFRSSCSSVPMIKCCPGFGMSLFCFVEKFAGYDSHSGAHKK